MGLYYRLDFKNNKNHLNQKDSATVIIDYYYKGKRTKVSTGVVCQIKDWDDNWRKKTSKDPIKSSDKDYRDKNLLIKNKLDEINGIVLTIRKQDKETLELRREIGWTIRDAGKQGIKDDDANYKTRF